MHPDRFEALSRSLADATSRRNLLKLMGVGVASAAVTAAGLNEALAKNNKSNNGNGTTYENQLSNLSIRGKGKKGTFKGTLNIIRFEPGGPTGVNAVGQLSGKVTGDSKKTGKGSKKSQNVSNQEFVFPVEVSKPTAALQAQVICEILDLRIQPIRLELLGLILTDERDPHSIASG